MLKPDEERYPYTDPQRIDGTPAATRNQQLRDKGGQKAGRPEGESQDINRKPMTFEMPKPDFMTFDEHYKKRFGTAPPAMTMPEMPRKRKKGK